MHKSVLCSLVYLSDYSQDENDQLRDMLEKSLNNHPQELSRSILEFLEERLPRGGEGKESDLLPLVQVRS